MSTPFAGPVAAWERFWFGSQSTSTLALVRIAVGLVASFWMLSLLSVLLDLYGPAGVMAIPPQGPPGSWSLFDLGTSRFVVLAMWLVGAVSAVALLLGVRARLAALLLFLVMMSLDLRNPLTANAGDALLRLACLYLALSPAGTVLSLDRFRRHRARFWQFPSRAAWPLRLMQLQLCVVYLDTVWSKSGGSFWRDGTASSYALQIGDIHRFPVPGFVSGSPVIANITTFGTLILELSIPILVWNRTARPWVLGLGVLLHLSIDYAMSVGFFSFTTLCFYLAFVPPEIADARILATRDAVRALIRRSRRAEAVGTPTSPIGSPAVAAEPGPSTAESPREVLTPRQSP